MYVKAYKTVTEGGQTSRVLEKYTRISGPSFAPSVDLTGSSIPVNTFEVSIKTDDVIEIGAYAFLYGDDDTLWAKYWVTYAEREDAEKVKLRAKSDVWLLDRMKLAAKYYSNAALSDVLDETILRDSGTVGVVAQMDYTLDSSFSGVKITGYCPEQTARERLLWIVFSIGGYVKTFWNTEIEILPVDTTGALIPITKTYWKPTVTYNDHVTALKAKYYSFSAGTPTTTDEYVTVGNTTYIVTETEMTIANTDAPADAPENTVTIEGIYLLNSSNVSALLTRLGAWYFKRTVVDITCVDSGEYLPGDKLQACLSAEAMVEGYAESASFGFGKDTRAALRLTAVGSVEAATLTIICKWDGKQIDRKRYTLPVGYAYTIPNPYIDMTIDRHRYIFRPLTENTTGTLPAGGATVTVQYEVALDLHKGVLHVISVDEVTEETDEITIGVIA